MLALYAQHHPEWPVHLGECPDGPWCKALALRAALSQVSVDADSTLIVADADVWCDGLAQAVEAVENGAPWAIPHLNVVRLKEDGTEEERPYPGLEGGGIVVLAREVILSCPPDPRFVGWG